MIHIKMPSVVSATHFILSVTVFIWCINTTQFSEDLNN